MSDIAVPGLLDRAIRRITTVWRDMACRGAGRRRSPRQMRACLAGRGGEVSARNRAAKLAETYLRLDEAGRKEFLRTLASFDSDPDAVATAYGAVQAATDPAERATAKAALRRALEPPRLRLLTQFTTIPDGRKFLVDLRGFLLKMRRDDKLLAALEADLRGLLGAVVRYRLPGAAADRLEQSRRTAGEAGGLRGGARNPLLARPEEPAGFRSPMLRVLPSAHAGRAADLRRGGAGEGAGRQRAASARREGAAARSARGGYRDLLLDQQLPAGAGGHQLRQFPDQARGRGTVAGIPQSEDVRDAVADSRAFARWLDEKIAADQPGLLSDEEAASLQFGNAGAVGLPGAGEDHGEARLVARGGAAQDGGTGAGAAVRALSAGRVEWRQAGARSGGAFPSVERRARGADQHDWATPRRRAPRKAPR